MGEVGDGKLIWVHVTRASRRFNGVAGAGTGRETEIIPFPVEITSAVHTPGKMHRTATNREVSLS